MAQDAALAFSRNLIQSFIQAKQLELQQRREKRYEDQLQSNRLFAQRGREIQQEQFKTTQAGIESRFTSSQAFAREGRQDVQRRFEAGQELTREGMESLEKRFAAGQELTREQMDLLQERFEAGQTLTREGQAALQERFEAGQTLTREGQAALQERFEAGQAFRKEQAVETKAHRTRTAERLEDTATSLERLREAQIGAMQGKKPFTEGRIQQTLGEIESGGSTSLLGHVIPFRNREGYVNHALRRLGPDWLEIAPEAADIINDRFPDEPKILIPRTAQPNTVSTVLPGPEDSGKVRVRDKEGNFFLLPREQIEQALSEGYELIGTGEKGPLTFSTTPQDSSAAFQRRTPDTGAAILGGPITQDFLPPDPDEGLFDRLEEKPEISAEKRTQAIDFVKSVLRQEKYAKLDDDTKIEIAIKMLAEQGIEVEAEELAEAWQVP